MVLNRKIVNSRGIKVFSNAPAEFRVLNKDIIHRETKQNAYILEENFHKIKYLKKEHSISFDQWAKKFNYKDFQIPELQKCYNAFLCYECLNNFQIQLFLDRGISNRFLERIYFLRTLVGCGVLPYFIVQFGVTEAFKKFNDNIFRTKNPAKNHGGTLSPFSKKFVKYGQLADTDKEKKIVEIQNKCKKTREEHPEKQNSRLEYFIRLYGDTDLAREKYRERQATRSLHNYIRIYGEVEGPIKHRETIERWLNTLAQKTQEEKDRINRAKASHTNPSHLKYDLTSQRGVCYYLKFTDTKTNKIFFKVGITAKSVESRFWKPGVESNGIIFEIVQLFEAPLFECWLKEQNILKTFDACRINVLSPEPIKTTEAFSRDVLAGSKIEDY